MDIFTDCEEMEDTESLKVLAKLLKNIGTSIPNLHAHAP
jgi:hypothetical protein